MNKESVHTPAWTGMEIAVIGMAGRFPCARNVNELWQNLINSVEAITFFSDQELLDAGVPAEYLSDPHFVKAKAILEEKDVQAFDSSFFGYTVPEAEIMTPQMRLFHEITWEALEDAGYDPHTYKGLIGLYAGAGQNYYWLAQSFLSGKNREMGGWTASQLIDKDFFTLRISYALNLTGPSFSLYTACSTSLVAIHLAAQALLNGECDIALAGGIALQLPTQSGYMYQPGMIMSPDGHCRTFDAHAQGTIVGSGGAVVVLKLLEDAIADRDNIYAMIKGSAINNDGTRKSGFTAPSVEGQVEVIQAALQAAHVEPETIGYVETHGTATALGDPIEIEALKIVYKHAAPGSCALSSIKTNIGHLDVAAGVAGFMKTVLALKHQLLPPNLHFTSPNPQIDFANSPFYVNTRVQDWQTQARPRRAAVSSFGIGGTNAHAVLEAWEPSARIHNDRDYQLILLSAKTPDTLEKITTHLAQYLTHCQPSIPTVAQTHLADVAYTLQVGRHPFKYRRMFVTNQLTETITLLSTATSPDQGKVKTLAVEKEQRPIIFMFAGLGGQYINMGRLLYQKEKLFRKEIDHCFSILKHLTPLPLKELLFPDPATANHPIQDTEVAQLSVFVIEYALAKLLIKWGIQPQAIIGYSFGEYVAACISEVFTLEEALKLVVTRGQLLKQLSDGAMLSVPLPTSELQTLLDTWKTLDNLHTLYIAIDNGPSCVVSGSAATIHAFQGYLKEKRIIPMPVENSRALHSPLVAPIVEKLKEQLQRTPLKSPKIPLISNVTGNWVNEKEITTPLYWISHLLQTVRFADGMKQLLKDFSSGILIEIGAGRDISALASRHIENQCQGDTAMAEKYSVLNLIRHPQQQISDDYFLLNRLGRLWLYGQSINWTAFHQGQVCHRISLPTYPFEPQKFPINLVQHPQITPVPMKKTSVQDFLYTPSWKRLQLAIMPTPPAVAPWLIFIDNCGVGEQIVQKLQNYGAPVFTVTAGLTFIQENLNQFVINSQQESDYDSLFHALQQHGQTPHHILHLWGITPSQETPVDFQEKGFFSILNIARTIGRLSLTQSIQISVVTNNMQEVTGKDGRYPDKATVLSPVRILPLEYDNIKCRSIDIDLSSHLLPSEELILQLLDELHANTNEPIIAYRGSYRWVPSYEPIPHESTPSTPIGPRPSGVFLITGALGGIGQILSAYLAKHAHPKLILINHTPFPSRQQWDSLLHQTTTAPHLKAKISHLKKLEEYGSPVLVFTADVTQYEQMADVIQQAEKQFGPINGVIHCAGVADGHMVQQRTRESIEHVLSPKITGTKILDTLLQNRSLDFFILCSSITAILPLLGQIGYDAANTFLDAFAQYQKAFFHHPIISVNWDRWNKVGIAQIAEDQHKKVTGKDLEGGLSVEEATAIFQRILTTSLGTFPQVVVSTVDIAHLLTRARSRQASSYMAKAQSPEDTLRLPRPQLDNDYVAPQNQTQEILAQLWARFFRFQKVGITDDFIDLGGDSLKALMMLPKINKELQVNIPISEFFSRATIQKLAQYIDSATKETYSTIEPVEQKEYYNLSPAQNRLFIQQQISPDSTAYNELSILPIPGAPNITILENFFRILIGRHEGLRTSFPIINNEPRQRIHDTVEFTIESYDTTQLEL